MAGKSQCVSGVVGRVMDRCRIGKTDGKQNDGTKNNGEDTGFNGFINCDTGRRSVRGIGMHLLFSFAISPDSVEVISSCVAGILA